MKGMVYSATSTATQLQAEIGSDKTWEWCKGSSKCVAFEAAHAEVKDNLTDWHKEFLSGVGAAVLRKKYTTERNTVEMKSFIASKSKVERLSSMCSALYRAHRELSAAV